MFRLSALLVVRSALKKRKRDRTLDRCLSALSAEDRQKVRAYLAINSRDEAFIRQLTERR